MAPSDDALDSGSSVSQETLAAVPHDSRDLKCDASSVFITTEVQVADGVGCLSIIRAVSLTGSVVDDGFGIGGHMVCCA